MMRIIDRIYFFKEGVYYKKKWGQGEIPGRQKGDSSPPVLITITLSLPFSDNDLS